MTRIPLADTFNMNPAELQAINQLSTTIGANLKNANSLITDFENNLRKIKGMSFAEIKAQMDAMAKAIKDQEGNTNALVLVHNKIKLLQTQELLLTQNLTKEGKQALIVEKQKLEAANKLLEANFDIEAVGKLQLKTTKDQLKEQGAEFISLDALSKKGKERVTLDAERLTLAEKYVQINGEMIKVSEAELRNSAESKKSKVETAKSMRDWAGSQVGITFSWGAIIKKLIDAYDQFARVGAMSKQITNQWSGGNSQLENMHQKIMDISYGFKISSDQAGEFLKKLSYAGMGGDTQRFAEEMMSRELQTGQGTESQFAAIKAVRMEYGKTTEAASGFLNQIFEAKKEIPYLSMDEVQEDILSMGKNMQAFNGNMLGAVGTYKVLLRDSEALKATGLGGLSQSMRREFASSLSSMSESVPDGMKAFFGMRMSGAGGKTPVSAIFKFEQAANGDKGGSLLGQFQEVSKVLKDTAKSTGMGKDEQIFMVRKLLTEMGGFSQAMIMRLAPLIQEGKVTGTHMQELLADQAKSTPNWGGLTTTMDDLAKYIAAGQSIATSMAGSLAIIELYITNMIMDMFRRITDLLKSIRDFWIKPEKSAYEEYGKNVSLDVLAKESVQSMGWQAGSHRIGEEEAKRNISSALKAPYKQSQSFIVGEDILADSSAMTKEQREAWQLADMLLKRQQSGQDSVGLELKVAGIDTSEELMRHALNSLADTRRKDTLERLGSNDKIRRAQGFEMLILALRDEQRLVEQARAIETKEYPLAKKPR